MTSAKDQQVAAETPRFVVVPNGTELTPDEARFNEFLRGFCAGAMWEHQKAEAQARPHP